MSISSNTSKARPDYYITIVSIYEDIKKLLNKWMVPIEVEKLASILFFENLYGYLQIAAYYGFPISVVFDNPTIREIIEEAKPHRAYVKIIHKLLKKGYYRTALLLLKCIYKIKLMRL